MHYIHNSSEKIFISNDGMIPYIKCHKYGKYAVVPLGIDHSLFFPGEKKFFLDKKKTKILFVGRLAVEKNIEDFLKISEKFCKIVVGNWPEFENLQKKYPTAKFLGVRKWCELAEIYRSVDVFVFPSKTDTLGLVNLEAMACGKPVVAYNIENMRGIVKNNFNGILVPENEKLESGITKALSISSENCINFAKNFHWENYAKKFLENQVLINKKLWN